MKNKWISYDGESWKEFKLQLTRDYIRKTMPNLEHSTVKYNFVDKGIWDKFVESPLNSWLVVILFSEE